jgi:hypothetical protein
MRSIASSAATPSCAIRSSISRRLPRACCGKCRCEGNADFERFVRQMLAFGRGANLPGDESMRAQMARLSQLELPVAAPLSVAQLLVHAELIVERRPQVNALVQQIMRSSTTSLLEELTGTYVEGARGSPAPRGPVPPMVVRGFDVAGGARRLRLAARRTWSAQTGCRPGRPGRTLCGAATGRSELAAVRHGVYPTLQRG